MTDLTPRQFLAAVAAVLWFAAFGAAVVPVPEPSAWVFAIGAALTTCEALRMRGR